MIKTLRKQKSRKLINLIKKKKPTAYIRLNGEKTDCISPKIRSRARMSTFTPLINIVLEILDSSKRQEIEKHTDWKGGNKTTPIHRCPDHLCEKEKEEENSKESTKRICWNC